MQLFVEIRSTVQRTGKPLLVPVEEVVRHTGFRSVFMFDEATRDYILAQGSTRDLRSFAVYSDTLFVDFDGTDSTAFKQMLIDQGIAFLEFDSGHRSTHYHITIEPMHGPNVAARQKAWMKEHASHADLSIYHNAAVYRLERTYHKSTGKPKILLASYSGCKLVIPELPAAQQRQIHISEDDGGIERFYFNLVTKKGTGARRPHLFLTAVSGFEAGLEWDEVMDGLRWMNARFDEPHTEQVIEQQATGGFQYVSRKYGKEAG
jgi:hypothetical protein